MRYFISYFRSTIIIQTILILVLGGALSFYIATKTLQNEKDILVNRVYNIAKSLDAEKVAALDGNEDDLFNLNYLYLKKKMMELKTINPDARFIYIMGYDKNSNKMFFFVDSELPESVDTYSPPGQIYDETTEIEILNFIQGIASVEGPYSDKWGRWVSAYAPVISTSTGLPIAIVGIDISASKFIQDIIYSSLTPFAFFVALAIIIFILNIIRTKKRNDELSAIRLEFTSFMSHEIRGFITKIRGGLRDLLGEQFGMLTVDQSSYVNELIGQSDEFGTLIEEFLDVGSLEQDIEVSLNKAEYNLLDIVKGVVSDNIEVLNKKGVSIMYEGNVPDRIFCLCDNNKISRVVSNIILNAVKYSPEKTPIHIGYIDSNTMHTIYFKDAGIGVPDTEKSKVFGKFFRATNARDMHTSGTGLGLYFSKLIVERHGGKIWFETSEGRGTTFFITLPKV